MSLKEFLRIASISVALMVVIPPVGYAQQTVISDGEFSMSEDELAYLVSVWPEDTLAAATNDVSARYGLLNIIAQNTRLANAALALNEDDGPDYYKMQLLLRTTLRDYMVQRFKDGLEYPDVTAVAAERYEAQKRKYAYKAERRKSSHILLRCDLYKCSPRTDEMKELTSRLESGESFEALAEEFSEDPGSRKLGGKFDQWIRLSDSNIDKAYREGLFSLKSVGEVTGVINSRFGLHIIRLDALDPENYKPFEQVKGAIVADINREYLEQQLEAYQEGFGLSEDAVIDGEAMDRLFAPQRAD
ncbi:peptidylprolyl isomerase [Halioglobus pacificus]|uniref:peptidylprolyl isomerase n=1 Tax=Parahalioglobus pacificus TaxID=930806 RepID=A0A919CLS8_9GAMM|nr:peptidylprolyl isomerase [Halioglobus pacificus]GHD37911.1 hypothetical protein GCM10007053_27560 [Halioglobus pacificus]